MPHTNTLKTYEYTKAQIRLISLKRAIFIYVKMFVFFVIMFPWPITILMDKIPALSSTCHQHSLVEALVDLLLVGESHHATNHSRIFGCPTIIADLSPPVLILDFHHSLSDRHPFSCDGKYRTQTDLLHFILIYLHLTETQNAKNRNTEQSEEACEKAVLGVLPAC